MRLAYLPCLLPLALLVFALGCQQQNPTAKEAGVAHWNAARAGVLLSLANEQFQGGNFEKCRESLDEALKFDPDNSALRLMMGRLLIEQGQLEAAERELKRAGSLDPKNPAVDYLSGVIYQRWQKPDVAYECYTNACQKAPAELAYLLARAEMLVALDRAPEALALLQEKVIYFEHSAAIRDAVGQLLVQQGKYVQACDMFHQAMVLTPDDQTMREHLGLALFYAKQYIEAASVLSRLVNDAAYAQRSDLITALAECQFELGHFIEARDGFESASHLDTASAGIWVGLAKTALQLNDSRRAELALRKCVALEPANAEGHILTGYLRLRQDRLDEALSEFHKADAAKPGDALSLCMIGYVLEKQGHGEQAIAFYAQALQLKPNDEFAKRLMAEVNPRE